MLASLFGKLTMTSTIVFFVIFLSHVPSGSALIKCFNCSSWENAECMYVKANDTNSPFVHACDDTKIPAGKQPFCRVHVQTIKDGSGTKRLQRRCGWIEDFDRSNKSRSCYKVAQKNHDEVSCQCFTDLCNSALPIILAPSRMSAATIFLSLLTYFYRH